MSQRARLDDAEFRRIVEDARSRHSLSDIIGRHTNLRRSGNEMKGICPFHQERTPSFEVNDAKGYYHCHGCGAGGDAIRFLMEKEGRAFREAVEILSGDTFPVVSEAERTKRLEVARARDAAKVAAARAVWANSRKASGTLAQTYLESRGLTLEPPPAVRFAMTWRWRDDENGEVGPDHPAVICGMQGPDGELTAIQRIFLEPDGRKWAGQGPAKMTLGSFIGSAFRIGPTEPEHIVITEGPEDGLTIAQERPGTAVWVACGTANMSRMKLPAHVRRVTFAGDNNAPGRAAVNAALAAYLTLGIEMDEAYPVAGFKDWNDQLRGIRL